MAREVIQEVLVLRLRLNYDGMEGVWGNYMVQ